MENFLLDGVTLVETIKGKNELGIVIVSFIVCLVVGIVFLEESFVNFFPFFTIVSLLCFLISFIFLYIRTWNKKRYTTHKRD